jgi:hypothetical protein
MITALNHRRIDHITVYLKDGLPTAFVFCDYPLRKFNLALSWLQGFFNNIDLLRMSS